MLVADLGGNDDKNSRLNRTKKSLTNIVRSLQKSSIANGTGPEQWASLAIRFGLSGGRTLNGYEGRDWVPAALKGEGYIGDDLDGLGSLWLHRLSANAARVGSADHPYDGLGRFLVGMANCNVVVLMWPTGKLLELGQSSVDAMEFWENLPVSEFEAFFKCVKHCPLMEGGAIWVPFGWSLMTCGLSVSSGAALDMSENYYFTMVHCNKKLFQNVDAASRKLIARNLWLIVMD